MQGHLHLLTEVQSRERMACRQGAPFRRCFFLDRCRRLFSALLFSVRYILYQQHAGILSKLQQREGVHTKNGEEQADEPAFHKDAQDRTEVY